MTVNKCSRPVGVAAAVGILGCVFIHGIAVAEEASAKQESPVIPVPSKASGPYCGVYSLYACLGALGKTPNFVDLLKVEYIGSARGSSFAELIRAAEECQARAVAVRGLSAGLSRKRRNR